MSNARSSTRVPVNWRAALRLASGQIVIVKVLNYSQNGVQISCPQILPDNSTYQLTIEVPHIRDASHRSQVNCKATSLYCILSGDHYRVGMKISEIPPKFDELLRPWASKPNTK